MFPKGRRLGPSSPSPPAPQEGPPFSAATRGAAAGRGGCGLCTASPRGSPTPPPRGLHGPGPLPHQPRGAPRGPLPAPPPPPPPPPGAAPGPHALRDTASRRREGSERRPGLTLERGARESALAGHVSLSSRRAATPPSRPPPGPRGLAEPSARVPAPVLASLLTAPAWGLSPSLLCVFLDLSLPPGKGSIFSGARGPSQLLLWGLASSLPSSQIHPSSHPYSGVKFKGMRNILVVKISLILMQYLKNKINERISEMIKIPHPLHCRPLILLAINAHEKARGMGARRGEGGTRNESRRWNFFLFILNTFVWFLF